MIYVLEVAVRGETTRSALEKLFHAYLSVFHAYATSGAAPSCSAPSVLSRQRRPSSGPQPRRHPARRGCAPRRGVGVLRSGPLGILARGGAASALSSPLSSCAAPPTAARRLRGGVWAEGLRARAPPLKHELRAPATRAVELGARGLGAPREPRACADPDGGPRAGRTPAAKPRGAEPKPKRKPRKGKARRDSIARQQAQEAGAGAQAKGWPPTPGASGKPPGPPRFRPREAGARGAAELGRRRHEGRSRRRGAKAGPGRVRAQRKKGGGAQRGAERRSHTARA